MPQAQLQDCELQEKATVRDCGDSEPEKSEQKSGWHQDDMGMTKEAKGSDGALLTADLNEAKRIWIEILVP